MIRISAQAIAAAILLLSASVAERAGASNSEPRLTPDGIGRVRIGMTPEEVRRAVGARLKLATTGGPLDSQCAEATAKTWPSTWFMFENGRLTRVSIRGPSRTRTPREIGIGATEAEVRKAYGPSLKVEPHEYAEPPARYLTYWTKPRKRGVTFETGPARRVEAIHAGGPSIQYVEGCL